MNNREHPDQKLALLLRKEIHCASVLLEALQRESAELASENPSPDPAGNSIRVQLIDALQQATQARINHMSARGMSLKNDRLADTASAMDENEALQPLFAQLSKLARQCFEENRLIGQMINRRTQFVTRMLDSLAPQSRNPHAETYAENGSTSSGANNALVNLTQ